MLSDMSYDNLHNVITYALRVSDGHAKGASLTSPQELLCTHAALAAAAGGSSLPLYHPNMLCLMLGQGRMLAVAKLLRWILQVLRQQQSGAAAAAAGGGEGGGSSSSNRSTCCSAPIELLLDCEDEDEAGPLSTSSQHWPGAAGSGTL